MSSFYLKLLFFIAVPLSTFSINIPINAQLSPDQLIEQLNEINDKANERNRLLEELEKEESPQKKDEQKKEAQNDHKNLKENNSEQKNLNLKEQLDSKPAKNYVAEESDGSLPTYVLISIAAMLSVGAFPIVKYGGRSFIWGEQSFIRKYINYFRDKYGKPQVPTGVAFRHNKSLEELSAIGEKLAKLDNDKFDNKEFLMFVRIKIALNKKDIEYQILNNSAQLLKAGIVTQKSFLRIEQTELRFRSYKQQKLYNFVVENLTENIDRQEFLDKVEEKVTEILPLLNTEEGKVALQCYIKEINLIAEHEFGLKLLRLFKQYKLADYSVLKAVSDIIDCLKGRDLRDSQELVGMVIENFEAFEKLAPIIEVPQASREPKTYASLIQYIGLMNRHKKSYYDFSKLLKLLEKWLVPYQLISIIRNEYTVDNYRLPKEFKQDIPGEYVFKKYEEYFEEKLEKKN
ncbi:hypothetical protein [Myxosarcina sp. GI1]|uniref:hypothetical protein n=1 Tax=Myxosarcina sp. GI1 TaxID=1541065 RepID=UPI00068F3AFD|nr:hypothetical protein [Myxosarcina sp. GI1]